MLIFRIYAHLGVSIQCFFMRYPKMRIKIGGWKIARASSNQSEDPGGGAFVIHSFKMVFRILMS